jgi:hypothetical protein
MQTRLTILFDLFLLWVIYRFALGGWATAYLLLTHLGAFPWIVLGVILLLLFYRSDYRQDLPLFMAGIVLGYWGEWWGTNRGVWIYWNGATPPDYLPPLWAIGVLTVQRLSRLVFRFKNPLPFWVRLIMIASFIGLPLLTIAHSWHLLAAVDWSGRLDFHFWSGLLLALVLAFYHFDLPADFATFLCGTLLGGFYEAIGTGWGEWRYITGETPPLWIAPLWGYACLAMTRLAWLGRQGGVWIIKDIASRRSRRSNE